MFCVWHGLATSKLDCWRRRNRSYTGRRLVDVEIETSGLSADGEVAPMVIIWPNGVRVELVSKAESAAVLRAIRGIAREGDACLR